MLSEYELGRRAKIKRNNKFLVDARVLYSSPTCVTASSRVGLAGALVPAQGGARGRRAPLVVHDGALKAQPSFSLRARRGGAAGKNKGPPNPAAGGRSCGRRRRQDPVGVETPMWWNPRARRADAGTLQSMPSPRPQYVFSGGLGGRVASVRRTDDSYEGAVSPPRRLFVGAAEKRRKRARPT